MAVLKRRKPKSQRRECFVIIRVTKDQKSAMAKTAEESGLDLSGWMRSLAMKEIGLAGGKK